MTSDFYNALAPCRHDHVFLAIVPLAFAAFGNLDRPLQIGAVDMAFPRVNMVSYQPISSAHHHARELLYTGRRARSGWTSYSPWLRLRTAHVFNARRFGHWNVFLITSSLLAPLIYRHDYSASCSGYDLDALAFLCVAQFVTAFLRCSPFPLEPPRSCSWRITFLAPAFFFPRAGCFGNTSKYLRRRESAPLATPFWFLGHPEVYVLILPGMGMVCEIIANNTRKPIWDISRWSTRCSRSDSFRSSFGRITCI